ncbi:ADP-ribosylglycohydrolase family protein [Amycolatopsis lurida]
MDEWLSDDELSVLARLARRQRAASGREAVRVERVELFVGTDAGGRRFLTANPVADWTPPEPRGVDPRRWRGSLLAGACGDALGAPIGMITDDTQMTLFTLEALIRAHIEQRHTGETDLRYGLQLAYQRWLHTQGVPWDKARGPRDLSERPDGWLITNEPLHHRRAPGQTCFSALQGYGSGVPMGTVERPLNESKGCGGVMRAAPAAIWSDDPAEAFEIGVMSAALTHSHPSGYLPAGTFAAMVHQLVRGASLDAALASARELLVRWNGHEETSAAIDAAIALAERGEPTPEKTATLGGGGVGETALSIALYAALVTDNPNDALLVSVNHGGDSDSDSTASVCGNLVGAMYGPEQLRPNWLDQLELRDVIEQIADDALAEFGPEPPEWGQKYPPSVPAREAPETGSAEPQEHRARTSLLAALETETSPPPVLTRAERFRGSILAGAVGDALGAAREFDPMERIRQLHGPAGITDLVPAFGGLGRITDDTQMTLFTLEGLIRAHAHQRAGGQRGREHFMQDAYQRWLHTQGVSWLKARGPENTTNAPDGWLITNRDLFDRRAPGATCYNALKEFGATGRGGTLAHSLNDSKGCGGVMRAAPAALWPNVFETGVFSAMLTHSHPTGYFSAGALAVIVAHLLDGGSLPDAVNEAIARLEHTDDRETLAALDVAIKLSHQGPVTPEKIAAIEGGGWTGESALAIAVYVALATDNLDEALLAAVNHDGDSDSTGAVCGNIAGALYGPSALRPSWLEQLELREVIESLIADALAEFGPEPPNWGQKYPTSLRPAVVRKTEPKSPGRAERFRGSILAGAVGDALGAADEFEPIDIIRELRGPAGITDLVPAFGGLGKITDDTQMTLFTLEGLIRGHAHLRRGGQTGLEHFVQSAYQRWLHTQDYAWEDCRGPHDTSPEPDGWLISHRELFSRRAPGKTCLTALMSYGNNGWMGSFTHQLNTSKGCGGVMRTAPAALWPGDPAAVFGVGAMAAALSHSHPTGYLSAGALSVIVRHLIDGGSLPSAVDEAFRQLARRPQHEETTAALRFAVRLAEQGPPTPEKIATIEGGGWIGESALAIAVYVALTTDNLDDALLAAVNHNGDSDSTGAICGNIAGALYGPSALRPSWLDRLELRGAIEELVADALAEFGPEPPAHSLWERKYPNS